MDPKIATEEQVALFKYGIIAPVLHHHKHGQKKYFQEAAQRSWQFPGLGERKFKWGAFKKWLHIYRKHGFDGLKPKSRKDLGISRKIPLHLKQTIEQLKTQFCFPTVSFLYRYLLEHSILNVHFSEQTLRKFLKDNQIPLSLIERVPRKKFEKEHINELWTADFMHGPYITSGKRKLKTYLFAAIDDFSRLIIGALFSFQESVLPLCRVLKDSILTYGLPQALYTDNGAAFQSEFLSLLCARLGISLIHSKPYDSPSRGKIERFFRTVREKFIPHFYINAISSLDELNRQFQAWLFEHYNQAPHSSINTSPLLRYHADLNHVSIKYPDKKQMDMFFYQSVKRLVRNDCTILFENQHYEVPPQYIGRNVEIRFSLENQQQLFLFDKDQLIPINKLNAHFNAQNYISYKEDKK